MIDAFQENRRLLFGIAYRMLGSVAEAEDMVQETFLRAQRQDANVVDVPKAWLVATITRLCIDQLRSARRRREEYVGVWLPEPLVDAGVPAPDAVASAADSLAVAVLLMLEELTPVERAAFLLREAFDFDYAEIARIVNKTEPNCRQMVSRAKAYLAKRETDTVRPTPEAEQIVGRFFNACATGDIQELLSLLTHDAVTYTDGGAQVRAARRPIRTADRVSRFLVGIHRRSWLRTGMKLVRVNGEIGMITRRRDGTVNVSAFEFRGGRICAIYTVSNPEKLTHLSKSGGLSASAMGG